jgi:hypothetical protein
MSVLSERSSACYGKRGKHGTVRGPVTTLPAALLAAVPGFHEKRKTQMLRVRDQTGLMRQRLFLASIILSFAAMVLALPIIGWFHLQSLVVCPFHSITGLPCPTCGYSRVFFLMLAGHITQAVRFQPFVVLIFVFCAFSAVSAAASLWRAREFDMPGFVLRGFWITLAASWVWNLCNGL